MQEGLLELEAAGLATGKGRLTAEGRLVASPLDGTSGSVQFTAGFGGVKSAFYGGRGSAEHVGAGVVYLAAGGGTAALQTGIHAGTAGTWQLLNSGSGLLLRPWPAAQAYRALLQAVSAELA
ncbi:MULTISPECIES: hypothetical protein [Arthrobacter]|uniref:hypothetical protein n=1 Tax=Arthrobacter TaxID=1663 RepID=UPI001D149B71|nr:MULTISPECIES: hypothetical protein [Arthrobacter]MCC3281143.1 hypothetical protein [Arthrobacter caoxuetaonis]MCC9192682.1 hypothetical protein [Arthrobacter sp. zg-Y916]